jgi:hypothetical protein
MAKIETSMLLLGVTEHLNKDYKVFHKYCLRLR